MAKANNRVEFVRLVGCVSLIVGKNRYQRVLVDKTRG